MMMMKMKIPLHRLDMRAAARALLATTFVLCSVGASLQQQQQQPPQWVECLSAHKLCKAAPACNHSFRALETCGRESLPRADCVDALMALQSQPIYGCKCRRGDKSEARCLRVYWIMHGSFEQDNDMYTKPQDTPYMSPQLEAEPGLATEDRLDCLAATSACNKNASCQSHRTEFLMKCMKNGNDLCHREPCHAALRQFYDAGAVHSRRMLFCACETDVCRERRRLTIMPECSYEQEEHPNCLSLHKRCLVDRMCRSRLDDFRMNCAPVSYCGIGCEIENYKRCLYAYTGLIGTVMTPNYVNTSLVVSPKCTCEGSGNRLDECQYLMGLFTDNPCLKSAVHLFTASENHGVVGDRGCASTRPTVGEISTISGENETSTAAKMVITTSSNGTDQIIHDDQKSYGGKDLKLMDNDNGAHRAQKFSAVSIPLCHLVLAAMWLSP